MERLPQGEARFDRSLYLMKREAHRMARNRPPTRLFANSRDGRGRPPLSGSHLHVFRSTKNVEHKYDELHFQTSNSKTIFRRALFVDNSSLPARPGQAKRPGDHEERGSSYGRSKEVGARSLVCRSRLCLGFDWCG